MSDTIIGSMRATPTGGVVHVEEVFATDPADLWSAITEPARLARWIAEVSGDFSVGGTIRQSYVSGWEGSSVIEVCEPPRFLRIRTTGIDEHPGDALEAHLIPEPGGTRLIVEDTGFTIEELPFHTAGWQSHLEDLAGYLESGRESQWRSRWETLTPLYQALPVEGA